MHAQSGANRMKLLFLGGTGNISTACVDLAVEQGHDVTVLNRGRSASRLRGPVHVAVGDRDDGAVLRRIAEATRFDAVVDFLAFRPEQVEAAIDAFTGRIGQYMFISSTSAYEKPVAHYLVTEATPLRNPFWDYARLKIACEERSRARGGRRGSRGRWCVRRTPTGRRGSRRASAARTTPSWIGCAGPPDCVPRGRDLAVGDDGGVGLRGRPRGAAGPGRGRWERRSTSRATRS